MKEEKMGLRTMEVSTSPMGITSIFFNCGRVVSAFACMFIGTQSGQIFDKH